MEVFGRTGVHKFFNSNGRPDVIKPAACFISITYSINGIIIDRKSLRRIVISKNRELYMNFFNLLV